MSALRARGPSALTFLAAGLAALGCVARAWHYLLNYSLNHDDAALALNIMGRSIWQLGAPLDHVQLAPWAFLAVERAVTLVAGTTEPALRLVPFLASLASVPAFWYLARQRLPQTEAGVAIGFFSVSQAMVGSAAQVKQYSTEVLCSILLLLACAPLLDDSMTRRQRLLAMTVGALAIWFSFSAVFVLAGIGLASIGGGRSAQHLRERLAIGTVWVISGLVYAVAILRAQLHDSPMFALWEGAFLPGNPAAWPQWFVQALENVGSVSTALRLAPLAAAALVVAIWLTFRSRRRFNLALASAILMTLLAACLRRYPFIGRFLFFAAPLLLLLVCDEIGRWSRARPLVIRRAVGIAASVALMYAAASLAKRTFLQDPGFDDPRALFAQLHQHARPRDVIFASEAAWPSLLYYGPRAGIDPQRAVRTVASHEVERVWFVFYRPTEAGLDQRTVRESGRSGVVLESLTPKRHTAVLWQLDVIAP